LSPEPRNLPQILSRRSTSAETVYATKIPLAKFRFRDSLPVRAYVVRFKKESLMAWKAPKIVEVPVGMEINMYACAARK
jgi:coenzyme PQQ precursor peptide PqqA